MPSPGTIPKAKCGLSWKTVSGVAITISARSTYSEWTVVGPFSAAINGPVTVHSEYVLLCDIVIATEDAYFEDAPHPAFGIVPGDGLHIVWPEVIGEIRGRYFLLSGQKLSAAQAKEYGAVNEVVSREALLPRAWELARHMKKQNALTLRYTRMALSTRFRRRLQEGLSYGLALEGHSAAQVAWLNAQKAKG